MHANCMVQCSSIRNTLPSRCTPLSLLPCAAIIRPPLCGSTLILHVRTCAPPRSPYSSLSEEEKAHLRRRLLDLVEQHDQQIAVQVW